MTTLRHLYPTREWQQRMTDRATSQGTPWASAEEIHLRLVADVTRDYRDPADPLRCDHPDPRTGGYRCGRTRGHDGCHVGYVGDGLIGALWDRRNGE